MSNLYSKTKAEIVLELLASYNTSRPSDSEIESAILDVQREIATLDGKFNKRQRDAQHLSEQVFRKVIYLKNDNEKLNYCRDHLAVARNQFDSLIERIQAAGNGRILFEKTKPYSEIILDYLFDLNEILPWLQRNEQDWRFIAGGKTSDVTSWQVYLLARDLSHISSYVGTGNPLEHRTAQIASIVLLRQAMELRFQRLVSVSMLSDKSSEPRLKHDFYFEFIRSRGHFFKQRNVVIEELWHLYEWCSEIVHKAYQPFAWQISLAVKRTGELLNTQSVEKNKAWSLFNAIEIEDVEAMQADFEEHFLSTYGHGNWKFYRNQPEAQIKGGWKQSMEKVSVDFLSVKNPRS
ncbi:hypothetical protein HGO37_26150 [Rhizobium sp. CG4]|uniref:hypothetical protein n=1 Tax=Rhizobium sp. CG4 TaxID=2726075 RepID=UPI002033AB7B|nr:hypothetical protein [Rhizobium sp. CG4]MCM2458867.1 hypothetical protein [Rhizobium sp. CG4]